MGSFRRIAPSKRHVACDSQKEIAIDPVVESLFEKALFFTLVQDGIEGLYVMKEIGSGLGIIEFSIIDAIEHEDSHEFGMLDKLKQVGPDKPP